MGSHEFDPCGSGQGKQVGYYADGTGLSGSMKCGEILDQHRNYDEMIRADAGALTDQ
jgi:hypothetical protein